MEINVRYNDKGVVHKEMQQQHATNSNTNMDNKAKEEISAAILPAAVMKIIMGLKRKRRKGVLKPHIF